VTLDGVAAVDRAFPALAHGHMLVIARQAPDAGEWNGLVRDAAGKLGPLANPGVAVSPTNLELLATCPLKWFYQTGLGLREPDDVAFDAGQWLDAMQRGSLLHEAFERFVKAWKHRTAELAGTEATAAARDLLASLAAEWRAGVPPPSEFVFRREMRDLERLMLAFLQAERDDFADGRTVAWRGAERWFPDRGAAPVMYDAGDGMRIRITGKIDRIDEIAGDALRVVDYKTGSSFSYRRDAKQAPCHGGRHLQPALYAAGAEQTVGGSVTSFEYRFPKERAPGHRQAWAASEFAGAQPVVRSLLTHPEQGNFVATDDAGDCRFCAFGPVCRVTVDEFKTRSPRAEWGKAHGEKAPEFAELRRRRGREPE
jgi:ATP-dependent helicase/nuclease subunit B